MLKTSIAVPILGGPLRGVRWLPASGGKLLRVLLGTYEPEQTGLFQDLIRPGDVVLDVGAHVGYYTMLAAVLTGHAGRVFAFEPSPDNYAFLQSHVAKNRRADITTVNAAVGDHAGEVRFQRGTGSGTGHVADDGMLAVSMVTLDGFARERGIRCDAIKIDVEGAEMAVLRGAEELLGRSHPIIFLSTHGPELHRDCMAFLRRFGYDFTPILGGDVHTSTELLCRVPATRA